jgi:hypothetical protein
MPSQSPNAASIETIIKKLSTDTETNRTIARALVSAHFPRASIPPSYAPVSAEAVAQKYEYRGGNLY